MMLTAYMMAVAQQSQQFTYWFDNKPENAVTVPVGQRSIDCSTLTYGLHSIIIFGESGGVPSNIETRWFYRGRVDGTESRVLVFVDDVFHHEISATTAELMPVDLYLEGIEPGRHKLGLMLLTADGSATPMGEAEFEAVEISQGSHVSLAVIDGEGADVTSRVEIAWRDKDGRLLTSGPTITGVAEGDTVAYSVALPDDLASRYHEVHRRKVAIASETSNLIATLEPFAQLEFYGTVNDVNGPLADAKVRVTQYLNDRVTVTDSTYSTATGEFRLSLVDAPTNIAVTSEGHLVRTFALENPAAADVMPLEVILEETGHKSLLLDLTFLNSTENGPVESALITADAADFVYTVTADDGTELVTGVFTKSSIALPRSVEAGDRLTVAISNTGGYSDTSAIVVVAETDETPVALTLEQAGIIKTFYSAPSDVDRFRALLYSADGSIVKSSDYSSGEADMGTLPDGSYQVVSVASDLNIGTLANIGDYDRLGFRRGTDYAVRDAEVVTGHVTAVWFDAIPVSDGSSQSFFAAKSLFSMSSTAATGPEILTATLRLNIDEDVLAVADGGTVIFSLPAGCVYEDGSMFVDGRVVPANVSGSSVSVTLDRQRLASRIRFCLHPERAGDYRVTAMLALDGFAISSAGEAYFHVSDYEAYVPERVATTYINISGTAEAFGSVEVYDDETKLGSLTADGFGRWKTRVELNQPANLSRHPIWARASDSDGNTFQSQPKVCVFDRNYIEPVRVTMLNTAHSGSKNFEQTTIYPFDGSRQPSKHYLYWPQYPDFTFLIDFTRNDPEVISAVELIVFTEDGGHVTLPTSFDASRQCWVASYAFPQNSLPINVDVDYVADTELDFDDEDQVLTDSYEELREISRRYDKIEELLNAANESLNQDDENQAWALVSQVLRMSEMSDSTTLDNNLEYQELLQKLDNAKDVDEISSLLEGLDKIIGQSFNSQEPIDIEALEKEMAMADSPDVKMSISIPGVVNLNITSLGQASKFLKTTSNSRALTPSFQILNQAQLDYGMTSQVYVRLSDGTVIDFDISQIDEIREQYSPNSGQPTNSWINTLTQRIRDNYGRALFGMTTNGASMAHTHFEYAENIKSCEAGIKDIDDEIAVRKKSNKFYLTQDHPIFKEWRKNNIDEIIQLLVERNVISKFLERAKLMSRSIRGVSYLGLVPDIWNLGANLNGNFTLQANAYERYNQLIDYAKKYCKPNSYASQLEQLRERHMNTLYLWMGFTVFFDITTIVGDLIPPPVGLAVSLPAAHISEWSKAHTSKRDGEFVQERSALTKKMLSDPNCQPLPPPGGGGNGGGGSAGGGRRPRIPNNDTPPIMDPSGIVYEGVVSMPVEGVTATIYHNSTTEGDGTVWNAEDYSQVNPQITDEAGRYQWDVPRGNWRVVFEKEGYEKAMTEWLPVPPPQLDVNVGLRKTGPAALRNALAFADEVTAEFDTYMDMASLTESSVSILGADEHPIAATVAALNGEKGADGLTIASKISIRPEAPIADSRVTLVIRPSASTYAGVSLPAEIRVTLTVGPRITALTAPATFNLGYDSEGTLRVKAEPAAAAAGRKLSVLSGTTIMYTLPAGADATFDANGYATLTLAGAIPGNAPLIVGIEGSDLTAETRVVISTQGESDGPAMPEASVTPGRVSRGTAVYLSCATSGATVYYTTDGSCPCDPASTRRVYDGSAIVIDDNTEIRAMAVAEDGRESDIAIFAYTVDAIVTGIEVNGVDAVKAYPVPTRGNLTIEAPGYARMDITVANMAGALVMHHQAEGASVVIDMSPLAAGTYLLTVSDGASQRHTIRVVKQ